MSGPRTAAGKGLLDYLFEPSQADDLHLAGDDPAPWATVVVAIEQEAVADVLAKVRADSRKALDTLLREHVHEPMDAYLPVPTALLQARGAIDELLGAAIEELRTAEVRR